MKIFPAVHYSMGGLWTDYTPGDYKPAEPRPGHKSGSPIPVDQQPGHGLTIGAPNNMMSNITGLYAFGEVNFAYHGANRLGANALLSCIFDGLCNGVSVVNFVRESGLPGVDGLDQSVYDRVVRQEQSKHDRLVNSASAGTGDPAFNPYQIGKELGDEMTAASTVVKTGERLQKALDKVASLRERYAKVELGDAAGWTNQSLSYARAIGDMLIMAEAMLKAGLLRKESRGAHYRKDFPERDDENFYKTSVARFNPATGSSDIEFVPVKGPLVRPRSRTYGKTETKSDPKPAAQTAAAAS
jgi:succinate dehydrogenase / fumarate reductase flavoprotein subunit